MPECRPRPPFIGALVHSIQPFAPSRESPCRAAATGVSASYEDAHLTRHAFGRSRKRGLKGSTGCRHFRRSRPYPQQAHRVARTPLPRGDICRSRIRRARICLTASPSPSIGDAPSDRRSRGGKALNPDHPRERRRKRGESLGRDRCPDVYAMAQTPWHANRMPRLG